MKNYNDLDLPKSLQHTLALMKFIKLTPIQEKAIPIALNGTDVLGSAQTGTGKTAAYLVPLISYILLNPRKIGIIILPTRELARQVFDVTNKLSSYNKSKNRNICLIGGESMTKQLKILKQNPHIIIGTPGRINDHLKRRTLNLFNCNFVILDETDRMLDMGFGVQIDKIFEYINKKRQVLMFSATIPANIVKLSNKYLNNPVRIAIKTTKEEALKIKHTIVRINEKVKFNALVEEINNRKGTIIIFGKTRIMIQRISDRLNKIGIDSEAIHGDLRQHKRERIIRNFHAKKFRILVATDVASRGLDIPHIEHVIINDLPQVPEDYIHRIGRTGRNGKEGRALVFLTPKDTRQWNLIQRILSKDILNNDINDNNTLNTNYKSNFQPNDSLNNDKNKKYIPKYKKIKDNKHKKSFNKKNKSFNALKYDDINRHINKRSNNLKNNTSSYSNNINNDLKCNKDDSKTINYDKDINNLQKDNNEKNSLGYKKKSYFKKNKIIKKSKNRIYIKKRIYNNKDNKSNVVS